MRARGVGYILRDPIFLPPLTLTQPELEALQLGMAVVAKVPDKDLAEAAAQLITKINAVLPARLRDKNYLDNLTVYIDENRISDGFLAMLRHAISQKQIFRIKYLALNGQISTRDIWPLNVEYWGHVWTCTAWCEARTAFRVFRIDRISECTPTETRFQPQPGRRYADYLKTL